MSKYPCGICSIGVKHLGIYCNGQCKSWYHSRCLNCPDSRLKKMEKSEVDLWRCNSCLNKTDVSNDIIDLEKKIHDLKVVNSLDHEMSLTLAAEGGNALLNENMLLKQELHELKAKAGESILEIEDRLKAAEDIIHELTEKNHNLQQDIIYLNKKLDKELSINQDLLEQAESEKNHYSITIIDLNSKKSELEDKIKRLTTKLDELSQKATCDEVERNGLRTRIVDLVAREESLSLQVNEKGKMIGLMKTESEELVMKISDLEGAARAYLRSFLGNIKSKIKLNICQNIEHDMPQEQYSPKTFVIPSILCPPSNNLLSSPISSTFETLTVPGLVETGGEDRQTSPKKLNWDKNSSQEQGTNLGQKMPLSPYTAKKLASGETLEEFFLKNIEDALSFRNDSSLIPTKRFSWAINSNMENVSTTRNPSLKDQDNKISICQRSNDSELRQDIPRSEETSTQTLVTPPLIKPIESHNIQHFLDPIQRKKTRDKTFVSSTWATTVFHHGRIQ
ncbi:hypothetical protein J6590_058159 [Homalodisca vitripennis]|nr:hypothetical protein J6590_058159 [Homalodisca vitripennis]